jgi:hypothetical protein
MGTRSAALKRWRHKGEHERMSRLMKSRSRPKVKVGVTPNLRQYIPTSVTSLLNTLADEAMEVVECNLLRVNRSDVWRIALLDGSDIALGERYYHLVTGHGLNLYRIHSRQLHTLGGVSVVLFVGLPKGEA